MIFKENNKSLNLCDNISGYIRYEFIFLFVNHTFVDSNVKYFQH